MMSAAVNAAQAAANDPSLDTTALEVAGLAVHLGGKAIVRDIALQLPRASTLALLGPSGCGKTTLLRAIAGLVAPHTGRILLAGRDVTALPPQQRGIGLVFQHYALFPNLSVLDNLMYGPLAQAWSPADARSRADELLALVGLQDHAHKRPAQLSGGQRQRVAMARSLAAKPALLLLDEPFSAIDESFRLPLRRAFRALQTQLQQTCVLVTHDRDEAFELADQVAVMLEGKIAQIGPPEVLLAQPASRAVAQFLGTFNLFEQVPPAWASQHPASCWAAPIAALQAVPVADPPVTDPHLWQFEAKVTARYPGLRSTLLELQSTDGQSLQMIESGVVHAVGSRIQCRLPLAVLHGVGE
jgi:ABC-type Fe3+/spermidine/putrescine transport system ATPase subunit